MQQTNTANDNGENDRNGMIYYHLEAKHRAA